MKRRQMQQKYLNKIEAQFDLPILQFPMLQEEIKGQKALLNL
jgi:hypothetical protein